MVRTINTARHIARALLAGLLALSLSHATVRAQTFPSKPITMIVLFAAGGATDVLARIVAEHMGRTLGQQIVVENVVGAGGTVGGARGAKAAPDGYTLTVGSLGSHSASPALYKNPGFDPREQQAIGLIAGTPSYFVVRKDFPAQTFKEYVAYVKANPDKVTMGHAGVGSTTHLACVFLETLTGIKTTAVAYRGNGPAMNDLVGGQIDGLCDLAPTVAPQLNGKTIRALMVALPERAAVTPDVPTSAEAGLPEYLFSGWNAIFAPKGTPKPIVDTLSAALQKALSDPAVRQRIEGLASIPPKPADMTPDALAATVARDVEKWGKVIREANIPQQ
jgi:tripartite-type tricarboxylate transporter receptor subunit TctC